MYAGSGSRRAPLAAACLPLLVIGLLTGCEGRQGRVAIRDAAENPAGPVWDDSAAKIDPVMRYGGHVLTAKGMPPGEYRAYLWAKNMGTLVAYETYLRRHPDGGRAPYFRRQIRSRFVPEDKAWQEAWRLYSRMEIIDGAVVDPNNGFILIGRPGSGRLPPFLYEDLIAALRCSLAGDRVGVTMNRVFPARFDEPKNPTRFPYIEHETSVDFYSKKLWNTHLAHVIFEGDRMLKSLGAGYDIFHRGPVRSKIEGFRTEVEMAAALPAPLGNGDYGRVWIELRSVKLSTTKQGNAAVFGEVNMEVRAESEHAPPLLYAKHLQEHYDEFAVEFPIFGEVERAARVVSIARWLTANHPAVARRLVDESYEGVRVYLPQVIKAKWIKTHKGGGRVAGLVGGVVFPQVNRYRSDPDVLVAGTKLHDVPTAVMSGRPDQTSLAWHISLADGDNDTHIAWNVTPRPHPTQTKAVHKTPPPALTAVSFD